MKFSTQTLKAIQSLLAEEFSQQVESDAITAHEVEQALRSGLQEIGQACLGEMLSMLDEQSYETEELCECQQIGKRVSRREAQLLSLFGWVKYKRSYYQCRACGRRWIPLDDKYHLRPGRATHMMTGLLGLAGVTVSFEEARQQIMRYLQVEVSANTIRQETQWIGERQAQREQAWVKQSMDMAYLQHREQEPNRPARLYGSIDGAFVPIEREWKEAKMVSWYRVGPRYGHGELHALDTRYYTSLEEAASFGDLLWGTAVQHRADQAQELVFICDGAPWIWRLVEHYFPDAVQIVDWYHACQYLYPVADMLFEAQDQQNIWVAEMKEFLWEGEVQAIIQTCQSLLGSVGSPAQKLITYFTNNQERMDYAYFRKQNYFIGSGTVESGCKQIITMRLKRSGARWSPSGASATAKARTAWLSGSWDTLTLLPLAV